MTKNNTKSKDLFLREENKIDKAFNVGDKVKLKFIDQYGFISRNDILSTTGCPAVEVMWIMRLNNITKEVEEDYKPSYQTCYKESLLVLGKYNNDINLEQSLM